MQTKVGIIGQGYVGLPLALAAAKAVTVAAGNSSTLTGKVAVLDSVAASLTNIVATAASTTTNTWAAL
jgi:UDP-N-acetyl-D-mannosaminuronate dehydrogenase